MTPAIMNDVSPTPSTAVPPVQFTWRSVITGMLVGGVLSLCNLYVGLKIGWGIGMSIIAALVAYGIWQLLAQTGKIRGLSIYETNISQTAASAAASITGAGLVAPIPALTMITGQTMSWGTLVIWTFTVCMVGVVVSIGLRRQMIDEENLPFPSGYATGKTLQEIYGKGSDAVLRLQILGVTALIAAVVKLAEGFKWITLIKVPGWFAAKPGGALEKAGLSGITPTNFGFSLDPTLLMYGVGAIIGPRAGISILLGVVVAWVGLAPVIFESGWAKPGAADASWFSSGQAWLLWPGTAIMVFSSLTSFAFSWKSILNTFRPSRGSSGVSAEEKGQEVISRNGYITCLVVVTAAAVILQVVLFDIGPFVATLGVLLTFMLALVAARVSGEVNVTPVTAMGKVTQLVFAVLAPANPAANLMSANVTGGAAGLCADMMHDLKTGKMIGAAPRPQYYAQVLGCVAGALIGCAGYLILIPDPAKQLLTEEWPAPSVAAWKSVAELFMKGFGALPTGVIAAMSIGACVGIVLAVLEKTLPVKARHWVPSGPSLGLAFLISPGVSFALFLGSMVAVVMEKYVPSWSARFLIIAASGIIAGDSLSGTFLALLAMLKG
jgi:putative OPT family oligopeptide transporter